MESQIIELAQKANAAKDMLKSIARDMVEVNPKEASKLRTIAYMLEDWQTKVVGSTRKAKKAGVRERARILK